MKGEIELLLELEQEVRDLIHLMESLTSEESTECIVGCPECGGHLYCSDCKSEDVVVVVNATKDDLVTDETLDRLYYLVNQLDLIRLKRRQ